MVTFREGVEFAATIATLLEFTGSAADHVYDRYVNKQAPYTDMYRVHASLESYYKSLQDLGSLWKEHFDPDRTVNLSNPDTDHVSTWDPRPDLKELKENSLTAWADFRAYLNTLGPDMPARSQEFFANVDRTVYKLEERNPQPVAQYIAKPDPTPSDRNVAVRKVISVMEAVRQSPDTRAMSKFRTKCDELMSRLTVWKHECNRIGAKLRFHALMAAALRSAEAGQRSVEASQQVDAHLMKVENALAMIQSVQVNAQAADAERRVIHSNTQALKQDVIAQDVGLAGKFEDAGMSLLFRSAQFAQDSRRTQPRIESPVQAESSRQRPVQPSVPLPGRSAITHTQNGFVSRIPRRPAAVLAVRSQRDSSGSMESFGSGRMSSGSEEEDIATIKKRLKETEFREPPSPPVSSGGRSSVQRSKFWHYVRSYNTTRMSERLLKDEENKIDLENRDDGETALTLAVQAPLDDRRLANVMVKSLIDSGADVNAASLPSQRTALHWAALYGNTDIVNYLLREDRRTDLDARDIHSCTPAMLAAQQGHFKLSRTISTNRRAHPAARDGRGMSAEDYITARRNRSIEQQVEVAYANIDGFRDSNTRRMMKQVEASKRRSLPDLLE